MRVWIEIDDPLERSGLIGFHLLMRVWIEICNHNNGEWNRYVSPSYEGVD
mgnify:CR=1 FL=1